MGVPGFAQLGQRPALHRSQILAGNAVGPLGPALIQVGFHHGEHVVKREPRRPAMRLQHAHLGRRGIQREPVRLRRPALRDLEPRHRPHPNPQLKREVATHDTTVADHTAKETANTLTDTHKHSRSPRLHPTGRHPVR